MPADRTRGGGTRPDDGRRALRDARRQMPRSQAPRVQRRFLLGSRWTAVVPIAGSTGERHFEVIAVGREGVTVRAVLTRRDYPIEITELEDAAAWSPGWHSLEP